MMQTYGIGDAARMTGITIKQLRYYEEKGYIQPPERVVCGERAYRRYTDEQIAFLRTLKGYMDKGYKLHRALRYAEKN